MNALECAVVTGGTRGIGRAIVERLIALGYFVEFTYINSSGLSEELEARFEGCCRGTRVDGSDSGAVYSFVADLLERSDVAALVNNAGITRDALIKDASWTTVNETFEVNFGSAFSFSTSLLKHMMQRRCGDIVMISSLAAVNVRQGNAFYGASKAALDRLTASLSFEAARFGVAVNTIAPGYVDTELIRDHLDAAARRELLREIPLRRFTRPEEVADAVAFLLSRRPMLIGATLPIGGGGHIA